MNQNTKQAKLQSVPLSLKPNGLVTAVAAIDPATNILSIQAKKEAHLEIFKAAHRELLRDEILSTGTLQHLNAQPKIIFRHVVAQPNRFRALCNFIFGEKCTKATISPIKIVAALSAEAGVAAPANATVEETTDEEPLSFDDRWGLPKPTALSSVDSIESNLYKCKQCGDYACDQDHFAPFAPGLYIGASYHANNAALLDDNKIGLVVNVAKELQNEKVPFLGRLQDTQPMSLRVPWEDYTTTIISQDLDLIADTIHAFRLAHPNLNVMSHCMMGRSRSVAAAIAFVLKYQPITMSLRTDMQDFAYDKKTLEQFVGPPTCAPALKLIKQTRGIAEPNSGFVAQLDDFARKMQWRRFLKIVAAPCANHELVILYLGPILLSSPWRPRSSAMK